MDGIDIFFFISWQIHSSKKWKEVLIGFEEFDSIHVIIFFSLKASLGQ